jgi:hypothetical protein
VEGRAQIDDLEDESLTDEEVLKKLRTLPGFGPFSAANMLQLLGRYSRIACDSETVRHLKSFHKREDCTATNVEEIAKQVSNHYKTIQRSISRILGITSPSRAT